MLISRYQHFTLADARLYKIHMGKEFDRLLRRFILQSVASPLRM
jgi:hypothetical protein